VDAGEDGEEGADDVTTATGVAGPVAVVLSRA
jgi:hypothetical protein